NPFLEKLLLEATLELVEADAVEALQDLGAAGLTCAVSEVAAKSGVGMRIDVSLVPRRAKLMTPYEVMLSESQERMLVIARPGPLGRVFLAAGSSKNRTRAFGSARIARSRVATCDLSHVRPDGRHRHRRRSRCRRGCHAHQRSR